MESMKKKQKSPLTSKQHRGTARIPGSGKVSCMDDTRRLQLIAEAVRYCQRVAKMGMPSSCYTKALREPIYFLWQRKKGKGKADIATYRSKNAIGLSFGNWQLVCDHAIPFKYLQAELLRLSDVTAHSVRKLLDKFGTLVLITRKES